MRRGENFAGRISAKFYRGVADGSRLSAGLLWLMLISLMLSGCAGREFKQASDPLSGASSPRNWQLDGRLALSNGRDGGSGSLTWQQRGSDAQLSFVGAFGRGGWRMTVTPFQAELVLSDGQVMVASDVGEVVTRATGWKIPVEALTYWVTGRAQPGFPATTDANPAGHLESLNQHGWRVQFDGRLPAGDGALPRKITATRGTDKVRLLVKRWQL
ncbi:MAG: lipoprotein insertase outer membrane protein LolB [Lysobacterales bacterium]